MILFQMDKISALQKLVFVNQNPVNIEICINI